MVAIRYHDVSEFLKPERALWRQEATHRERLLIRWTGVEFENESALPFSWQKHLRPFLCCPDALRFCHHPGTGKNRFISAIIKREYF